MPEINSLKIALVHDFLTKIGGAEKVLLVLHEMFPDAPIYTTIYDKSGTKNLFTDCKIIASSLNKYPSFIKKRTKYFLPFYSRAIEEFNLSEFDIVISSSNSFAHGVITNPQTFHLCYCHSPMRYAWDYAHEYLKENNIGYGLKGLLVRKTMHKVRVWDKISSDRVDSWIANSENVRSRIKKYYQFDSEVLFPPAPTEKIAASDNIPDDYYLIVSRLEPYKKVDLAIRAFSKLQKPLVIIGMGSELNNLKKIAGKNVEFLGWQSDKSVHEYMKNAKALIFPGEDDAGMTPIESMAAGRPVIAYNKGGARECIIEGKTGILFDELNEKSLIDAILRLEKNYMEFTTKNCRDRALEFSTAKFKEKFSQILKQEYHKYKESLS